MQKIILSSNLVQLDAHLNSYMLEHIRSVELGKFEAHSSSSIISFDMYDILNSTSESVKVIIYFAKDKLFFICENEACLKRVKLLVKENLENEHTLHNFFIELIKSDTEYLEKLEEKITGTEDDLLTNSKKECADEIIAFRRELLKLKKYYDQLNQIFEGLIENENNLISIEDLRYFRILDSRIDRLFASVLNLRDYVTQVREAYQAKIDIEQNSLMKVFTVVTAIFMPLTLLVGWYGMNLNLPEFSWKYGYALVISLSAIIVIVCVVIFKRKKWF